MERLTRDKDEYAGRALAALRSEIARLVPAIAAQIKDEVGGRSSAGGARRNSAGALVASGSASGPRPQPAKSPLGLFPVVLHLLSSPYFRTAVVSGQLVADLASWLTVTAGPAAAGLSGGSGGAGVGGTSSNAALLNDFKTTLMHVLEVCGERVAWPRMIAAAWFLIIPLSNASPSACVFVPLATLI